MARITDQNKIERLKESTMKLVAEKGYGGASATLIASDAKVSTGYFYLHYEGKYEMVNALLGDMYQEVANKLDELINQGSSFDVLTANLVDYFFKMANAEPIKIRFFYVLSSDYRFKMDENVKISVLNYLGKILEIGQSSGELDPAIRVEDLYLFLIINTIQYINQIFRNSPEKTAFEKAEEKHLLYLLKKFLK
jgi:AcrR family transcriptional regulator